MASQNPAKESPHLTEEADIGCGERTPGQRQTDAIVEQVGTPLPPGGPETGASGKQPASDLRKGGTP